MKIANWVQREVKETMRLVQQLPPWVSVAFVLTIITMNLMANKCIVNLSWIGIDGGLLFSWGAFLIMDVVVKCYGPQAATRLSIFALLWNLVFSAALIIGSSVPGVWGMAVDAAHSDEINFALNSTFKGTWYVLFGSSVAFVTSAVVNNFLNYEIGKHMKKDGFLTFACRAYVSTAIGQFVDNFIFVVIVCLFFFHWTLLQCMTSAIVSMVFELVAEILFSPLGYKIAKIWQKDREEQAQVQIA